MATQLTRYRFNVDDYYRLAEAGILKEDARVELIRGEIIEMNPIGSRHAACVDRLNRLLNQHISDQIVRIQNPIRIEHHSEPEPDLALLKYRDDYYAQDHPQPNDVLLLIEVSDSTLIYDQQIKIPLYAEANIPEVWVVNLDEGNIEAYRDSDGKTYQNIQQYQHQDEITVPSLELTLNVQQVFG